MAKFAKWLFVLIVMAALVATGYYTSALSRIAVMVARIRVEVIDRLPTEALVFVSLVVLAVVAGAIYRILPD